MPTLFSTLPQALQGRRPGEVILRRYSSSASALLLGGPSAPGRPCFVDHRGEVARRIACRCRRSCPAFHPLVHGIAFLVAHALVPVESPELSGRRLRPAGLFGGLPRLPR